MATAKKNTQPEKKMTIAETRAENEKLKEELEKIKNGGYCYMCGKHKKREDFYVCTDPLTESGIAPICKRCARRLALRTDKNGEEHECTKDSMILALRYLDKPFLNSVWDASVQESENLAAGKVKSSPAMAYFKNIQMVNYLGMTFKDSDMFKEKIIYDDEKTPQMIVEEHTGQDTYDDYLKNKKDVVRLLSYDPFEQEAVSDQPFLYSQLLGLLDAGGDENDDMMRNASAISIVRGFLQSSKIDNAIANLMTDVKNIDKNSATIKSLQESKGKITSVITSLAAESCISLKNNKNAKKGENTWTGKIKKIKDLDLRQGRVNGFDIETSKAMRQVMDLSHKSILQELKLDETDWSDMVAEQRNMIVELQRKLDQYMEISRILLNENLDLKDFIEEQNIDIQGYSFVDLEDLYACFSADYEDSDESEGENDEA